MTQSKYMIRIKISDDKYYFSEKDFIFDYNKHYNLMLDNKPSYLIDNRYNFNKSKNILISEFDINDYKRLTKYLSDDVYIIIKYSNKIKKLYKNKKLNKNILKIILIFNQNLKI